MAKVVVNYFRGQVTLCKGRSYNIVIRDGNMQLYKYGVRRLPVHKNQKKTKKSNEHFDLIISTKNNIHLQNLMIKLLLHMLMFQRNFGLC